MRGTLIRILPNKGYAFVRGDDDHVTRFAHAKAFLPDASAFDHAREGQSVEFRAIIHPEKKGGGHRAVSVVLLPAGFAAEKL